MIFGTSTNPVTHNYIIAYEYREVDICNYKITVSPADN